MTSAASPRLTTTNAAPNAIPLASALLCPSCGNSLQFDANQKRSCCKGPAGSVLQGTIVRYQPGFQPSDVTEMKARDALASDYLKQDNLRIQIHRIRHFLHRAIAMNRDLPVLDLACGPGPTTALLLERGYRVIGVDFSTESLALNARACGKGLDEMLLVQADLNTVRFAEKSATGLMMSNFLQHLGTFENQTEFLRRTFCALVPGGWFFLSVLNTNLKNYLRGDIAGSYLDGAIRYRRLTVAAIRRMMPSDVTIEQVIPLNIFNDQVLLERVLARLPMARWFSRLILFCGRKQ